MAFLDIDDYFRRTATDTPNVFRFNRGVGPVQPTAPPIPAPAATTPPPPGYGARALGAARTAGGVLRTGLAGGLVTAPFIMAAEDIYSRANVGLDGTQQGGALGASFAETPNGAATGVQLPSRGARATAIREASTPENAAQNRRELTRGGAVVLATPGPENVTDTGAVADALNSPRQATATDFAAVQNEGYAAQVADGNRAFGVSRQLGATDGSSAANDARIRGFGANPGRLAQLNEIQRLDRTGIVGSRDANGQISFTNDPTAQKRQYEVGDGSFTTDYNKSAQYAQGVQLANQDKAALAALTERQQFEKLEGDVARANAAGATGSLKTATDALNNARNVRAVQQNNAVTNAVAGAQLQRQTVKDQNDTLINAAKAQAAIGKDAAETTLINTRIAEAEKARVAGKGPEVVSAILSGRASTDSYTAIPNLDPNKIDVLNRSTGAVIRKSPQVQATPVLRNGKYYVKDPTTGVDRELTVGELARFQAASK